MYNTYMINPILLITLFFIYSVVLVAFSIGLFLTSNIFVYKLPAVMIGLFNPNEFTSLIWLILCELFAVYIWMKAATYLKTSKSGITLTSKEEVIWIWVFVLTFMLPFMFFSTGAIDTINGSNLFRRPIDEATAKQVREQERVRSEQEKIGRNQNAAKHCISIEGLCVTNRQISYSIGDTLSDSLDNAKNVCADLGMRLPTKEDYALLFTPLADFNDKVARNLSDEEFVTLEKYYKETLRDYRFLLMGDNLTSSVINDKAVVYKVNYKQHYDYECRNVDTGRVYGHICIEKAVGIPGIEQHGFNEPASYGYSLLCVK